MPNQNPAGINQPLDQRPIPSAEKFIVGADQLLITDVQDSTDVVVVTIPSDPSVVREVGGIGLVNVAGTTGNVTVNLVYQDPSGNEAIIATGTLSLAAESRLTLTPEAPFFLTSEDTGLVIRTTNSEADAVEGISQWTDIRGVERNVVTLVSATAVGLLPAIAEGRALRVVPGTAAQQEGELSSWLLNFDSLTHATLTASVKNSGGTSVRIPLAGGLSVAAGVGGQIFEPSLKTGHHTTGGNINVTDASTFGTGAPVIMTAFVRTNLGEVAPEQASAF